MKEKNKNILIISTLGIGITALSTGIAVPLLLKKENKNEVKPKIIIKDFSQLENSYSGILKIQFTPFSEIDKNNKEIQLSLEKENKIFSLKTQFEIENDEILINLYSLEAGEYKIKKIGYENKVFDNLEGNEVFVIKEIENKKETQDEFSISKIENTKQTINSIEMKISFEKHILENVDNKTFSLSFSELNGTTEEVIFHNNYDVTKDFVIFDIQNLKPSQKYEIKNIKINGKVIEIQENINREFETLVKKDNFKINTIDFENIQKTSAEIQLNFSSYELANEENKKIEMSIKNLSTNEIIKIETNDYVPSKELYENKVENLTANTKYEFVELKINDKVIDISSVNNKVFTTKKEVDKDSFIFKSIRALDVTENSAKIEVVFEEQSVLKDDEVHNFEIDFSWFLNHNSSHRPYSNEYQYDAKNKKVTFELKNLWFASEYSLSDIVLNGQKIEVNDIFNFQTKKPIEQFYVSEFKAIPNFDNKNLNIHMNFKNVPYNKFETFFLELEDLDTKEKKVFSFLYSSNDNLADKYSLSKLLPISNEEEFDFGALVNIEENKKYKLSKLFLYPQELSDDLDFEEAKNKMIEFIPTENLISSFNTIDNSLQYKKVEWKNNSENLIANFEFHNLVNTSNSMNTIIKINTDFGAYWELKPAPNASKMEIEIANAPRRGNYWIEDVIVDNESLRRVENEVTKFNWPSAEKTNTISEFIIEKDLEKFGYFDLKVKIDNQKNLSYLSTKNSNPILEIIDINTNEIKELTIDSKTEEYFIYKIFDSKQTNSYKFKNLSFINGEDISQLKSGIQNTLTLENYNNRTTLDSVALNSLVDKISSIDLYKKWWASGIKNKLKTTNDFIQFSNIGKYLDLSKNDIEIEIANDSFSNYRDQDGKLEFKLILKSGNNKSKSKTIAINNLYSKNFLINNTNLNPEMFNKLITLSKNAWNKKTSDFDKRFEDNLNKNTLEAAFGVPNFWVELNDVRLKEFVNIDDSIKDFNRGEFQIYLVKAKEKLDTYKPEKTLPFAMLGSMEFELAFWFDNYNPSTDPESKYKYFSPWFVINGLDNHSDKYRQDLFWKFKKELEEVSTKNNIISFNKSFGIKTNETNQQLIKAMNAIADKNDKWKYILSKTNLEKITNQIINFTKESWEPPIANNLFEIHLVDSKEITNLGQNKYLEIQIQIRVLDSNRQTHLDYKNKILPVGHDNIKIWLLNNN